MQIDFYFCIIWYFCDRILRADTKHFYCRPIRYFICIYIIIFIIIIERITYRCFGINCCTILHLQITLRASYHRCRSTHFHIKFKRLVLNMGIPVVSLLGYWNIIIKGFCVFLTKWSAGFVFGSKPKINAMSIFF